MGFVAVARGTGVAFGILVALAGAAALAGATAFFAASASSPDFQGSAVGAVLVASLVGAAALALGAVATGLLLFGAPGAVFGVGLTLVSVGGAAVADGQSLRAMASVAAAAGERGDAEEMALAAGIFQGAGIFVVTLGAALLVAFLVWADRRARTDALRPVRVEAPPRAR